MIHHIISKYIINKYTKIFNNYIRKYKELYNYYFNYDNTFVKIKTMDGEVSINKNICKYLSRIHNKYFILHDINKYNEYYEIAEFVRMIVEFTISNTIYQIDLHCIHTFLEYDDYGTFSRYFINNYVLNVDYIIINKNYYITKNCFDVLTSKFKTSQQVEDIYKFTLKIIDSLEKDSKTNIDTLYSKYMDKKYMDKSI